LPLNFSSALSQRKGGRDRLCQLSASTKIHPSATEEEKGEERFTKRREEFQQPELMTQRRGEEKIR